MTNPLNPPTSATEPAAGPASETGLIVVGIDDSPGADHALRWAITEGRLRGSRVKAVYAWTPLSSGSGLAEGLSSLVDPMASIAPTGEAGRVVTSVLERVRAEFPHFDQLEGEAVLGDPAFALLEAANDADLIVVGTRGRGGVRELLLGSTSTACAHHSHRPLAIIGEDVHLPGRGDIVVGVDDSPGARRAVAWAVAEATRREAKVVLVNAWHAPVPVPPPGIVIAPMEDESIPTASTDLLEQVMEEALVGVASAPEVELVSTPEPAATALLDRAEDADLLVVGGRGRGGFLGLLLGSVSHQVLHHAPCAVVVVPDPAERPRENPEGHDYDLTVTDPG